MGASVEKCCSSERERSVGKDEIPGRVRFDLKEESRAPLRSGPDYFDEDASDTMTAAEKMEVLKRASKRGSRAGDGKKRLSNDVQDWLSNTRKTGRRSQEDARQLRRGSRDKATPIAADRYNLGEDSNDDMNRRSSLTRKMDIDWNQGGQVRSHSTDGPRHSPTSGRSASPGARRASSSERSSGSRRGSREHSAKTLLKGFRSSEELKVEEPDQAPDRWEAQLKVTIRGAKNLRSADVSGKSDPYCTCEIQNKPHTKFQTKVLNNESNPAWNHIEQLKKVSNLDAFNFAVFDSDVGKDDCLGRATLTSAQWFPGGFQGMIPLGEVGKSGNPALEVNIAVIEAHPLKATEKKNAAGEDLFEF